MKMGLLSLFFFLAATTIGTADAAECKETNFGKCFNVHGRYNIYVDGDAIWIIGTKRRLDAVDDNLDMMLDKAGWEDHSIYGDFVVCPESTYQPRHRQAVCIQSYKNIRLGQWK
jgi:hypothetical protein